MLNDPPVEWEEIVALRQEVARLREAAGCAEYALMTGAEDNRVEALALLREVLDPKAEEVAEALRRLSASRESNEVERRDPPELTDSLPFGPKRGAMPERARSAKSYEREIASLTKALADECANSHRLAQENSELQRRLTEAALNWPAYVDDGPEAGERG